MLVSEVIQHGWLVKSPREAKDRLFGSLIKKQWKKKYFVLTYVTSLKKSRGSLTPSFNSTLNLSTSVNDKKTPCEPDRLELAYYDSEKQQRLQGCIDLMRCEEVVNHVPSAFFKHVFAIKTYHKNTRPRTYYLVAACEQEMLVWVNQLTTYLRMLVDNGRDRHPLQTVSSVPGVSRALQRQPSINSTSFSPAPSNLYSSPPHAQHLFYSSTIHNHHSSSTNIFDQKNYQKNKRSNENSPSLPRAPFLKRMDSITQRSERPLSRMGERCLDYNSPQSSKHQLAPGPPLPDLHAFLPLITHNSTLPRSRAQCQTEENFSLYDHPPSTKEQHMFFDRVHDMLKWNCNSIDRRKMNVPGDTVYDVPASKNRDSSSNLLQSNSPTAPSFVNFSNTLSPSPPPPPLPDDPYDVPASIKISSNDYIYDTPGPKKENSPSPQPQRDSQPLDLSTDSTENSDFQSEDSAL